MGKGWATVPREALRSRCGAAKIEDARRFRGPHVLAVLRLFRINGALPAGASARQGGIRLELAGEAEHGGF